MFWQKVVVNTKGFNIVKKTDEPERLLYLRAIQGHSGRVHSGNAPIDFVLQDNVLLLLNFTKYVYHVGHGNELRSIVSNGPRPGGFSTEKGRYAVFFTVMNDKRGKRETFCDLSQARIAPDKNTWKHLQNTVHRCKLLLALNKEDCDFTKQGLMQLFSMTHCQQS